MTENYGYEIDMLPVGDGERSGDAIAIRYGNAAAGYKIMVVDGGTKKSGTALVEHIKQYYQTTKVDYMVCTHPDADHSSGLRVVMDELEVGQLWMHRPWEHSTHVHDFVTDGRVTPNSLKASIKEALCTAHELEEMATERGIPIFEPFQGARIGLFRVLSPSQDFYKQLLTEQYGDPTESAVKSLANAISDALGTALTKTMDALTSFVGESLGIETLREDGKTSPLNESSVVMHANIDGYGILLTGDAGIRALTHAADYAEKMGIALKEVRCMQIPHHGSRNNVSPSILNRLIGEPLAGGYDRAFPLTVCVSAAKLSTTHPRRVVTNAFHRRGATVLATQGQTKCMPHNMPNRPGWVAAQPVPFHNLVESYDDSAANQSKAAA